MPVQHRGIELGPIPLPEECPNLFGGFATIKRSLQKSISGVRIAVECLQNLVDDVFFAHYASSHKKYPSKSYTTLR
jgi:hypothetical protein